MWYDVHFPFWNDNLTALCGCQVLLSFKPIRTCFCRAAKTADVTRQPGQSGSSSPRAPDRPAEPHDGWALSISWVHLWPVPDYSWRLSYSLLSSALHAPLTPHSPRGLLELSHHSTKGKIQLVTRRVEEVGWWGCCRRGLFFSPTYSFILFPVLRWHCQKMKECYFGLF